MIDDDNHGDNDVKFQVCEISKSKRPFKGFL